MRTIALAAFGLSLLTGDTAYAQQAKPSLADPVALFQTVCLGDQVKLPAKDFQRTSLRKLPRGAADVLAFSMMPEPNRIVGKDPLSESDLPNQLLAVLPKKDVFLILPAAPDQNGRFARQCAVAWRGNHFDKALDAAETTVPRRPPPLPPGAGRGIPGLHLRIIQSEGTMVAAAELQKWTVLRVAPDLTPAQEPPAQ